MNTVLFNPKKIKGKKLARFFSELDLQLMIFPSVVLTLIISYFPVYGIIAAFKRYDVFKGIINSPWASSFGMEHFIDFFNSPSFSTVLINTVFLSFLKLLLLSFPPVILAIMYNEINSVYFKKITQTITYLPHFASWVIIGGVIYTLLSDKGPLNILAMNLGLIDQPYGFMSEASTFRPLAVISELWKEVGWNSIIYLGVISTIDTSQYEAIGMDGGGRWAKILHVTWPAIKGTFMILFILSCGNIMSGTGSTFEQSYILGNNMTRDTSDVIDTYVLRTGLEFGRYSFATAVGLFKSVINLILLLLVNKISYILTEKSLY